MNLEQGENGDCFLCYGSRSAHHVQKQLGFIDHVNKHRGRVREKELNKLNVKLELQADFFAGVWAHQAFRMGTISLEPGDLESAITATTAVGDDTAKGSNGIHCSRFFYPRHRPLSAPIGLGWALKQAI